MAKQGEEEAWGSGGQNAAYYPAQQSQYTYAYSNPAGQYQTEQAPAPPQNITSHPDYLDSPPPMPPPQNDLEGQKDFVDLTFSQKSIRAAFIRKVFALVTLMLLIVVAECAVTMFVPSVNDWMRTIESWYFMGAATIGFFVLYFVIICVKSVRRSFPINIILAFLMAFFLGALVAQLCAFYTVDSILLCAGLLVVSTASIALFSCQTKFEMIKCSGIAILLTMYLFWIGIFSCGYIWWYNAYWMNMLWSVLACTIFMIYLAIDIQLIMGGHRMSISPEEYIFASVQIFIDVVYIFVYLLQIFGIGKR